MQMHDPTPARFDGHKIALRDNGLAVGVSVVLHACTILQLKSEVNII
jgi:hypothetical protein